MPSGYTEVEYIESTGTQYIDTGFTPNQDTRMLLDFQYTAGYRLAGVETRSNNTAGGQDLVMPLELERIQMAIGIPHTEMTMSTP